MSATISKRRRFTYAEATRGVHAKIDAVAECPALATVGLERLAALPFPPSEMDEVELTLALMELQTSVIQMHFALGAAESAADDVERWTGQLISVVVARGFPPGTHARANDAREAADEAGDRETLDGAEGGA